MKNPLYLSLSTSGIMITLIFILLNYLPPEVPLLYGNAQGQDQLVPKIFLIIGPIGAIVVSFINYYIASKITDDLYQKSLGATTILVNFMVVITIVKIIFLVGLF